MNINEQIKFIRKQKHDEYLKYIGKINDKKKEEIQKEYNSEIRLKQIRILAKLRQIIRQNKKEKAVKTIQKFIRDNYFKPICINNDEINKIPPIYRIRISITTQHINEYSEKNIPADMIDMHRLIYKMVQMSVDKFVLFRYCFDIRKLYPVKNQIIEILGGFYFMQPDDHIRINSLWKKINNETNESIRYLIFFEYQKTLSIDRYKNIEYDYENEEKISKEIEKILDKDALENNNI